jgi:hypothetical protein
MGGVGTGAVSAGTDGSASFGSGSGRGGAVATGSDGSVNWGSDTFGNTVSTFGSTPATIFTTFETGLDPTIAWTARSNVVPTRPVARTPVATIAVTTFVGSLPRPAPTW